MAHIEETLQEYNSGIPSVWAPTGLTFELRPKIGEDEESINVPQVRRSRWNDDAQYTTWIW